MDVRHLVQIGQEWSAAVGAGGIAIGILGWIIRRKFEKRDKAEERGRQRVDAARPDLVAITNAASRKSVALQVTNNGKDVARTLRISVTGVPEMETKETIPAGKARYVTTVDASESPLFTVEGVERAEILLVYADIHQNEYRLVIPIAKQKRDDDGFNIKLEWQEQQTVPPTLTKKRLREIGA